jgi:phospholipase C
MLTSDRRVLSGSDRQPYAHAMAVGPVRDDERVEVTIRVRAKAPQAAAVRAATDHERLEDRRYLTREQHCQAHGASADDLRRVEDFGRAHGLAVVEASEARRSVVLAGAASAMKAAFEVDLQQFRHAGGTYRGRVGAITIPQDLADVIVGVFGLDNRPQAQSQLRRPKPKPTPTGAASGSFTPPAIAGLYSFPPGLDGTGQCIAIIELGGGFRPADLATYFEGLGKPQPEVTAVSVDQGQNAPTTASGADGEVMLDIEVAGAIAPGAAIAVYFAPNTDQGFLDAVTTAVHDSVNKPSVVSISWGSAESQWTAQAMTQFDEAFQAAATMGVTICVAAGDNGSGDDVSDGAPHVDFPASSPNALGCGGTSLSSDGTAITSETVWNDGANGGATGGGVSSVFPLPAYQSDCGVPPIAGTTQTGRGVPDVAGNADPATGYQIRVDGQDMVVGGTSAVAPLWASLIALMNQKLAQPVGLLQPLIYGALAGKGVFNDVVTGSNGAYTAGAGWDACTGWGSPIGSALLQALAGTSGGAGATPPPAATATPDKGRAPTPAPAPVAPPAPGGASGLAAIQNIVVLMLENRSFDHMLGLLYADRDNVSPTGQAFDGLTGKESNPGPDGKPVTVFPIEVNTSNDYFMPGADPGEGYQATNLQLFSADGAPTPAVATNAGFLTNFSNTLAWEASKPGWTPLPGTVAADIMGIYTPAILPVLSGLAKGFAVCDQWFSSVPTETLPNRAFACAATSQGHMDDTTKTFTVPSIFGLLSDHGVSWKIHGYTASPLTKLNFTDTTNAAATHFGQFADFQADAASGSLTAFTFLEPDWGATGNSQHPNYSLALGEQLIHDVYDALRNGPQWHQTLLIITYDEHGGCYDHVSPPTTATPPDASVGEFGFDFKRFGVRVPTVLVSPLIAPGTVFRVPATSTPLDHTSILKTVEKRWGLPALTARDAAAPDVGAVLTLASARTDDPLAGVTVPRTPPGNPAEFPISHLEQVHAELVSRLPVPDGAGGGYHTMPSLVTSADAKAYIAGRSAAWEAARLVSGSLKG